MKKNFLSKGLIIAATLGSVATLITGCGANVNQTETVAVESTVAANTLAASFAESADFVLFVKYDNNVYYQTGGDTLSADEANELKGVKIGITTYSDIPDTNTTAEEIETIIGNLPSLSSNIPGSVNVFSVVSDPDNRQLLVQLDDTAYQLFEM